MLLSRFGVDIQVPQQQIQQQQVQGLPDPQTGKTPKKRAFTPEEDSMILMLLSQSKEMSWKEISQYIPGKTTRQSRERYQTYLAPGINQSPWTQEEDSLLLKKYNEIGPKWAEISKFFNGRSANALKNRFNVHIIHRSRNNRASKNSDWEPHSTRVIQTRSRPSPALKLQPPPKMVVDVIQPNPTPQKQKNKYPSVHQLLSMVGINDTMSLDAMYNQLLH